MCIRDRYVFVMLGLYAGLRREEILALQWDSVYLDTDTPYPVSYTHLTIMVTLVGQMPPIIVDYQLEIPFNFMKMELQPRSLPLSLSLIHI